MRLFLSGLVFTFFAGTSIASGLPEGTFVGQGNMKTPIGMNSDYESKLIIANDTLTAHYVYTGGREVSYAATFRFRGANFFDLYEGEIKIGNGYTDQNMVHMNITEKNAEETLFFDGTVVKRIGSMQHGPVLLMYTELLNAD